MNRKKGNLEVLLNYLGHHRMQARMVIFAFVVGFIIVALGVAINLASSSSIVNLFNALFHG